MKLHLGAGIALPADAVTQTFGILAVRGAGKSNLAAVMAEEMHRARLPFVVVDPVGAWWGLRSSADGTGAGLSLPIFGGRHADVPLEEAGGQLLADLVVDDRLSCVLDIAELSEGAKTRFLIDFAERLYRRNTEPLHLFLEEADDYAPQRPFREQARLLRAWENVVRRGRARGLGITLITQRSAALNKNVLTQVETLFVLRTTSPQDRKAIGAWVEYHGQSREILESLDQLGPGEAWVWSPQWLKLAKRVQIRRRSTFDSGATPKNVHGARPAATLADVDLASVRIRMAATIERAKAEDPRALRSEVARLRAELAKKPAIRDPAEIRTVEKPVLLAADRRALGSLLNVTGRVHESVQRLLHAIESRTNAPAADGQFSEIGKAERRVKKEVAGSNAMLARARRPSADGDEKLGKGERAMLAALAPYPAGMPVARAALIAGYSPRSSTTRNILSSLRTRSFIEGARGDLRATPSGLEALGDFESPPSGEALRGYWLAWVGREAVPGKVLGVLCASYPAAVSRDRLADLAGGSAASSTYRNALSTLRTLGLIEGRGEIRASEHLFT